MINIIACIGKNNELGKNNKLIWHLKEDLANFKNLTMNKKIVMGTNTYKSLPNPLAKREYILLSHSIKNIEEGIVFNDFDKLLNYLNSLDEDIFVIGGSSIYNLFLNYADTLYLTEVDEESDCDVYFPKFNKNNYNKTILNEVKENNINYKIVKYVKK